MAREAWGFVIGSLLFGIAAVPGYAEWVGVDADNITYFVGSLFFTGAGFIALRLSGRPVPSTESENVEHFDWWAALVQFVGTLLFNASTGIAMVSGLTALQSDKWVWRPDVFGSFAFLVASGLAVVATTETDKLWDPEARNWRSTWLNMVGSIAFGISAVGAFVRPATGELANAALANLGTFVGAVCFLVAALLMRPLGRVINNH
nr:YrhK family protein [Rhodococcus sp. (in: high G+C Gram-positive bacteria)]